MNPQTILTFLLGLIGAVTFLGTVVVYLRGSTDKGTITSLKGSVDALQIEGKIKDTRIEGLEKRDKEKDVVIASLTNELNTLRNVVTQAEEVKAISLLLAEHHDESMEVLNTIRKSVARGNP